MSTSEFLRTVLGTEGYICVGVLPPATEDTPKPKMQHKFLTDIEGVVDTFEKESGKKNVYFSIHRFSKRRRLGENAIQSRSMILDLDVNKKNKTKCYASKREALAALIDLCKNTKLPRPIVVDSGNGIHAYWPFEEPLPSDKWKPAADRFKKFCVEKGLIIDTAVTADLTRLMRAPDTINLSGGKQSRILFDKPTPITLEKLYEIMGENYDPNSKGFLDALKGQRVGKIEGHNINEKLASNIEYDFKKILHKTLHGRGCQQLQIIATQQETVEEPLWRAGLSIAKFCKNGEDAAHKISCKYPSYSEKETDQKLSEIKGPYTCERFDDLNPDICTSCPNRGKVKTPLLLGRVMAEAETEVTKFVDEDGKESEIISIKEPIPNYPFPYRRGKKGGIYQEPEGDDEDPVLVYQNDFYPMHRMVDPIDGETVIMRLHLPHDKPRDFNLPLKMLTSIDRFREIVSSNGIAVMDYKRLKAYTTRWVHTLQEQGEASRAVRQFGWHEHSTDRFAIGDRIILADSIEPNFPTKPTAPLFKALRTAGSLGAWKDHMNFYKQPGMEIYQYMIARSFGSALMHMIPSINAAGMHIYSKDSGYGKTTLFQAAASVWGNPESYLTSANDTLNFLFHRAEVHGSLPFLVDELTGMEGGVVSSFLLSITSGQQRGRLFSSANDERERGPSWNFLWATNANESLADIVAKEKHQGLAEAARVMEVRMELVHGVKKANSDMFTQGISENYGWAGPVFAQYLVKNYDGVKKFVLRTREDVDRMFGLTGQERFWSADIACTLAANAICQKLKLTNYSSEGLKNLARKLLRQNEAIMKEINRPAIDLLTDFVYDNWGYILTVSEVDGMQKFKIPDHEARNKLVGRYETRSDSLFVSRTAFKMWCNKGRLNYSTIEDELLAKNSAQIVKKRLGAGSKVDMNPISCIKVRARLDVDKA